MKNLLQIRIKALALTVIFLIGISGILFAQPIAIIDAGSSGSRLYVYYFDATSNKISKIYSKSDEELCEAKQPLSAVKGKVPIFLDQMTRDAENIAQLSKLSQGEEIPLYILATAGMRLVSPCVANQIYKEIKENTAHIPSPFKFKEAMTISGRYEGLYAWIAANYKNGGITYDSEKWTLTPQEAGILEIGGASLQITFARPSNTPPSPNIINYPTLGGIFSKSYLGAGVNCQSVAPEAMGAEVRFYPHDIRFFGLGGLTKKAISPSSTSILDEEGQCKVSYIKGVFSIFKLTPGNGSQQIMNPEQDSSWTEGAALAILLNPYFIIEEYSYATRN